MCISTWKIKQIISDFITPSEKVIQLIATFLFSSVNFSDSVKGMKLWIANYFSFLCIWSLLCNFVKLIFKNVLYVGCNSLNIKI